jgi:7-cyano-7-deazaguanine synthase
MMEAIRQGTYANIELLSPFMNVDKTEIVKIGKRLNVPYELTYSCYKGEDRHCGKCGTCYERREAFNDAGVEDPTIYE